MQDASLTPPTREATIEDVAARAGVSIRTISRVVNSSPLVNAETRARVQEAIAELRYRPSPRARALAMRRSFLIGLVHNDRNAMVLDSIQRGVVATTSAKGYELVIHPSPSHDAAATEDLLAFITRSRVDGLVILPPVSGVPGLAEALAAANVPAVALSSVPISGFSGVIVSEERAAGAEVARHLLELGHRKLGIINGPADVASATERRAGFIAEAALHADVRLVEARGDYSFASGVAGAEELLAMPDRPTGVFAANDIMAAGVLKVAANRGIAVPEALSVVGFDGSILTDMLTPALTSVARPFVDMAAAAASELIARVEGTPLPAPLTYSLKIAPGESTGPAPA